jgi:pentatricopeptide repeat protein
VHRGRPHRRAAAGEHGERRRAGVRALSQNHWVGAARKMLDEMARKGCPPDDAILARMVIIECTPKSGLICRCSSVSLSSLPGSSSLFTFSFYGHLLSNA